MSLDLLRGGVDFAPGRRDIALPGERVRAKGRSGKADLEVFYRFATDCLGRKVDERRINISLRDIDARERDRAFPCVETLKLDAVHSLNRRPCAGQISLQDKREDMHAARRHQVATQ